MDTTRLAAEVVKEVVAKANGQQAAANLPLLPVRFFLQFITAVLLPLCLHLFTLFATDRMLILLQLHNLCSAG
jgi:hypothetical protein